MQEPKKAYATLEHKKKISGGQEMRKKSAGLQKSANVEGNETPSPQAAAGGKKS